MSLVLAIVGIIVFIVVGFLFLAIAAAIPFGMAWLCEWLWQQLWSRMMLPVTGNRILYWPLAIAIVCPLLFVLLLQLYQFFWLPVISEYFFAIFGLGLAAVWIGAVIVACRLMIQWAAARQWRTVLSTLILPLTALLVLSSSPFFAPFLWRETDTAAEYAKFFMNYHSYLARVEKEPATEPRFAVWADWPYDDSAVLYDETDEIAADHQSGAWKEKAKEYGVICCRHRRIIGHFYYVGVDLP